MLSEEDFYNSNTAPNDKVNPKTLGAMWINYDNGKHYICNNNTFNKNVWLDPIGELTNRINSIATELIEKLNNIKSLGINQQWYDVTSERMHNVKYYNDTGNPICVLINTRNIGSTGSRSVGFYVNDVMIATIGDTKGDPTGRELSVIVPDGSNYMLSAGRLQGGGAKWFELR